MVSPRVGTRKGVAKPGMLGGAEKPTERRRCAARDVPRPAERGRRNPTSPSALRCVLGGKDGYRSVESRRATRQGDAVRDRDAHTFAPKPSQSIDFICVLSDTWKRKATPLEAQRPRDDITSVGDQQIEPVLSTQCCRNQLAQLAATGGRSRCDSRRIGGVPPGGGSSEQRAAQTGMAVVVNPVADYQELTCPLLPAPSTSPRAPK